MAKPNYSFQKRQRELAKKQKKEAKLKEKELAKAAGGNRRPTTGLRPKPRRTSRLRRTRQPS
jgi:hypothetical protein